MNVFVFFCGRHTLPDRFEETFARLLLVSAGALALIPTYLLRIYTQILRHASNRKGEDSSDYIGVLDSLSTAHRSRHFAPGLAIIGTAVTAVALRMR